MADEEDVIDNWEDAETEELERRMEERQKHLETKEKKAIKSKVKVQESEEDAKPIEVQTQLPLRVQDSDRTEYVAPIKILKRQVDSKAVTEAPSASIVSTTVPKQHKSLAEREAEYASARARILGSSYSPEDGPVSSQKIVSRVTENSLIQENVKRQPRGPNDTTGFKGEDSKQ